MRHILLPLVLLAGCENFDVAPQDLAKDPVQAVEDALFDKLTCDDVARPSTLARIRALVDHPSADTAGALLFAPEDLATLVSVAGPEAEVTVVVTRNLLKVAQTGAAADVLAHGWDGVQCAEPQTLECTAGAETVTVSCDARDQPYRIDLALARCTVDGTLLDGKVALERDGADVKARFLSLSIDETQVVEGELTLTAGATGAVTASVRAGDGGLRVLDHGGVDGGLPCGEQLEIDALAFAADGKTTKLEVAGSQATPDRVIGIETFGEDLTFDGSCACAIPGSGIAFDVPKPFGKDDEYSHVKVTYGAGDAHACASAAVELDDAWPKETAGALGGILSAFCVTP